VLETLTIHAPDFDPSLGWLGTDTPVSMRELRGHLVILDFFTSCCVNCMHVAPILHRLETRFEGQPVVVLGVHSGKFDHEQEPAVVEAAMHRMGIRHPVLVDEGMRTWHAFAVRSWPTLVVVRPDGTIGAVAPGEPDEAALHALVTSELDRARARGHLAREARTLLRPVDTATAGLRFPSKLARSRSGALAVSDTGHARVIVWSPSGTVEAVVGAHEEGDTAIVADLEEPQGLAFDGDDCLFIADARRHTVVEVQLSSRTARVVAGTGRMGTAPLGFDERPALTTALRSPWDLVVTREAIVVAMSGSHQLASLDRARGTVRALAGTGAESRLDGAGRDATFSQPNGLTRVGDEAVVADSESSSLRAVHLVTGETRTLLAGSLFTWGDVDGPLGVAQLQHPMGVALANAHTLAICDTYNGKLKVADLETGLVRTVHAGFREATGVVFLEDTQEFLVADPSRHGLVVVSADGAARPFEGPVPPPSVHRPRTDVALEAPAGVVRFFDEVLAVSAEVAPGEASLTLSLSAGATHHFAAGAPYAVNVEVSRRSDLVVPGFTDARGTLPDGGALTLTLPLVVTLPEPGPIASELVLRVNAMACGDDGDGSAAVCEPFTGWWRVPLVLARTGAGSVTARAAQDD
jgi:thiol-disulfide isomerase/thioredoxin